MPRSDSGGAVAAVRAGLFGLAHFRMPDGVDKRLRTTQLLSTFNRWVNGTLLINALVLYFYYFGLFVAVVHMEWPGTFSEGDLAWMRLAFTMDDGGLSSFLGALRGWVPAQFFLQTMVGLHRKLERVVLVDNGY